MRTPTIASVNYAPNSAPLEYSAQWLQAEFERIKAALDLLAAGHIEKTYSAPVKPRQGNIRYADGTAWNPGSGEGIYVYLSTGWTKL